MKCDEFLASYETGSTTDRMRARLHARRCPTCAGKREWLKQVRAGLTEPAKLSAYHRRVWEQVAVNEAPQPLTHLLGGWRWAIAGGVAVAALVVVACVILLRRGGTADGIIANRTQPTTPTSVAATPLRVSAADIAAAETGLKQVEADLKRLAEEAARLEARRAIQELAAMYQPIESGDST